MRRLSAKLTYANVIATLALFVALGGVGYAASKLPKNSVHTKQLANNSVTSPKVKDGTLGRADLAAGVLPNPVDLSNYYDKSASDARFYDKSASDSRFYDKSASDARFYDKAQSDARFLATDGTAADSAGLGSYPASAFPVSVRDNDIVAAGNATVGFGRRSLAGGAGDTTILDVGLLGEVGVSCSDPAQPSIFYRNTQQDPEDVWTQNMISGTITYASVGGESNSPSVLGSAAVKGASRWDFIVGSGATSGPGRIAVFDVTTVTAPGGAADNSCLVQVQSQSLTTG
jgi:hypothetical protein